jgi:hypothetical protein
MASLDSLSVSFQEYFTFLTQFIIESCLSKTLFLQVEVQYSFLQLSDSYSVDFSFYEVGYRKDIDYLA